ncbi:MAG: hypothetical protein QGF16_09835, partial [Rhodospirillales bacterium]|nr:hypothetical protein [Rhodospirillales bacterium]
MMVWSGKGFQRKCSALGRNLEHFPTKWNHLTGMILPRGEEHFAWPMIYLGIGIGKDVRRRPRVKSTRPAVGQIGSPGALRRQIR